MPSMIVGASFGADSVLWLQGAIGGSVSGGRELAVAVVCRLTETVVDIGFYDVSGGGYGW